MVARKGNFEMAKEGINCGYCGIWIPVGVRIPNQKFCNNPNSTEKTVCQIRGYSKGRRNPRPAFIMCDTCGERIDNPSNTQVRCQGENGGKSECQKKADQKASTKHKSVRREQIENAKKRICLKCGKKFPSMGAYNRICDSCTKINEGIRYTSMHSVSGYGSDLTCS